MFAIRLGDDNLATQPGKLTTKIYLEIDGRAFPDDRWYDQSIILLGWWIENYLAFAGGRAQKPQPVNSFMEGPYAFTLSQAPGAFVVSFLRGIPDGETETMPRVTVPIPLYREVLVEAAERCLALCDALSIDNRDIASLRAAVAALKAIDWRDRT